MSQLDTNTVMIDQFTDLPMETMPDTFRQEDRRLGERRQTNRRIQDRRQTDRRNAEARQLGPLPIRPNFPGSGFNPPGFYPPGFNPPGINPPGINPPGINPPGNQGNSMNRPNSPPPSRIPERPLITPLAVDSGSIRFCLFRFTYVWLRNGAAFWLYPVFIGRNSIAGFRWGNFGWTYTGIDLNLIDIFECV